MTVCLFAWGLQELVHEELLKIAEAAAPRDLGRFPALQRRLAAAVLEYIQVRTCWVSGYVCAGCLRRCPAQKGYRFGS